MLNRFFTNIFEDYFEDCSLAFRATKIIANKKICVTHHDAIKKINEYKKKYESKDLWVAECDMKKFYDSVNHNVIKKCFKKLIKQVKKDNAEIYDNKAERLFYSYLKSYSFNNDVLHLNDNQEYFKKHRICNGEFGWIEKDINKKYIKKNNIGVPQGGALSGLIANIVLNEVDKRIVKNRDKDLFYIRYCDDMIIMHPNRKKCEKAINMYKKTLRKLKLIPHKFKCNLNKKNYWKCKSKGPYKWSADYKNGFPWIGFVGYEINHDGSIRVRKSSLKKEMTKQFNEFKMIYNAIRENSARKSKGTIKESLINRYIGMSVGRIKLWNYTSSENDLCWTKGFTALNKNKYSVAQLKRLDRSRNKCISRLNKMLDRCVPESNYDNGNPPPPPRDRYYYGKPFSYYYHVVEKRVNN